MNMPNKKIVIAVSVVLVLLAFVTYWWTSKRARDAREAAEAREQGPAEAAGEVPLDPPIERDWEKIKERGTIVILAPYNSTTYFLYRGEPLGYEYELLQAFAREQGVALKMKVVTDRKSLYSMLNNGDGDLAASRLVPT